MKISRDNYEPFFLDYLEGNLNEGMMDQFLDFLERNPDLKAELQSFENQSLSEEKIVFKGKEQLYKNKAEEKSENDEKLIAWLEGDMEIDERESFKRDLASQPGLQKEYELFTKTLFTPDLGLKFPSRNKLYRKSGKVILLNWLASAAAVLILLFGIGTLFQTENISHAPKKALKIAASVSKPNPPVEKTEPEKSSQKIEVQVKEVPEKSSKSQSNSSVNQKRPVAKIADELLVPERELIAMSEIAPKRDLLESEPLDLALAVRYSVNIEKLNDSQRVIGVDEFIADRVKKVGDMGMFSFQRLLRTSLGIASEITGERIGYGIKDGKISSIEFESKLIAFSIPMEKE